MTIAAILAALVAAYPGSPARRCIRQRAPEIAAAVKVAEAVHGVPPPLLVAVAFRESHLGCDRASGGCWGAPASRTARHRPGTHLHAAASLARGYRVCGSWDGAVARFRTGLCRPGPRMAAIGAEYLRDVHSIVARIERRSAP